MIERNFLTRRKKTMKKANAKTIAILSLSVLLAACTGSGKNLFKIPANEKETYYGLAGKLARHEYNGLLSTTIGNLNYLKDQEAVNAQHFANFVDGLLTHNEFGVLTKNLASKVTHSADYKEFEFTVRSGVKWQRYDGTQYEANIDGEKVPQFVKPSDWVTSIREILKFSNKSKLPYLITPFIEGAAEYYVFKTIQYNNSGEDPDIDMTDYEAVADEVNRLLAKDYATVWELQYGGGENPVTASDIPAIMRMQRVGIIADDEHMTLKYKLLQSASYFPTLFTYSICLPTNEYFLKEIKSFAIFGTEKDKILYCGPYLLSAWEKNKVVYTANPDYWNAENTVTVDKINYKVILDTSIITPEYTRQEFESGRIDGFGLSIEDGVGWQKYITGKNNDHTYEDPIDARVNARLLDQIGSMYGSNIIMERDKRTITSYSKSGSDKTVKNAAKALRLADVRRAILDSYDLETLFNEHFSSTVEELRQEQKVWTYVPRGFVIDADGKDYVDHYLSVYAREKGLEGGAGDYNNPVEGTAAYELKDGQVGTKNLSQDGVNALIDRAMKAVQLWNEANPTDTITLPIQLECYTTTFSETSKPHDEAIVNSLNKRLNKGAVDSYPYFKVVHTDKVTSQNYESVSRSGDWDISTIQWGWGADYGDPLTFMNTYVKHGDWADVFPYIDNDYVANYEMNEEGTVLLDAVDLLEEYGQIVREGSLETEDFNARYDKFAEAEYLLIEKLGIYKPQTNTGHGWSFTVSRSAGYFVPQSNYGLSNDRMTGMYVLDKVMTRAERKKARDKQDEAKAAYLAELGGSTYDIYDR